MCADTAMSLAIPCWTLEALLNDPLVRIVMHADGVTRQDILAAFEVAYQAARAAAMASSSRPADPRGHRDDPRGGCDDPRGQPARFAPRPVFSSRPV